MFFNGTISDLNKYPMNYNMFADSAMAMAAAPGCNSDILPTEFIYPNYNLNHYPQQNNNNNNNNMQQQYLAFPANNFQGVPSDSSTSSSSSAAITPAVIVCSQQGPGTDPQQQYTSWNIDIATTSNPTTNAQLQLTSAPFISIPAKSVPTPSTSAATATTATVAWINESEGGGGDGQTTRRPKHQQQQQQQLHIITSLESGIASMYPHISGSQHHHGLDLSAASSVSQQQQPCIASPAQQAAMSAQFQSQPQYQHHASWGMAATTSSPVEPCFNSGSSTPSFASSMSPTLSYTSFELGSSGDSSRATSPSHHNQHHHHHHYHGTPYDTPSSHFDRRHRRRDSDAASSLIIRSRKSSTSSTSSNASQRRMSNLRESTLPSIPVSPPNNNSTTTITTSVSSPTHQCPTCNLCFAGPAVLVRHIESIHDKLLWNCVGCKSNLSRRDAVTRHINLSPMDSVCRAVGTIGQIKMLNGSEVHYEISSYKAKPLDEVMNRMGKKISVALRQEIDRAKAMTEANNVIAAASAAAVAAEPVVSTVVAMGVHYQQRHHQYQQQQHDYGGFPEDIMVRLREAAVADGMTAAPASGSLLEMEEELMMVGGEYDDEMEYESDGSLKKRRRPFQHTLGQRKK
ncbi:hypothetical protein BGZ47_001708 [Haplosporangium gracile]|nr:hypothetical protein BGZ47_001708 [Haplosporangium gracile]